MLAKVIKGTEAKELRGQDLGTTVVHLTIKSTKIIMRVVLRQ